MNTLNNLRAAVDAARKTNTSEHVAWLLAKDKHATAKAAADEVRYQAGLIRSRGGPRALPGFVPPSSKAELAETEAQAALSVAEQRLSSAKSALASAEAALLARENELLGRWRDAHAREIKRLQSTDASRLWIEAMIQELRAMTPDESNVRINQRFRVSALVREVLETATDGGLKLDTPVDELRGDSFRIADYDTLRASILREAEANPPLEAA